VFAFGLTASLWLAVEALVRQEHDNRVQEVMLQNANLARLIEDHAAHALVTRDNLNSVYFSNLYKDLNIGKQGIVTLVGADGIVRVRVNNGQQSSGQNISTEPTFQHMLQTKQGSLLAVSALDGVARIFTYRMVANHPLLVVVGSAFDEALTGVSQRARQYRRGAVLASMAIAGAALWLMHLWRRQQNTETALRSSKRFLHTLTDILPGMVSYWSPDLRCSFANQDYFNWFGRQPEEILGQHISTLLGPDLYQRNLPHIQAALHGQAQQFERNLTRQDGSAGISWVHYIPDIYQGEVRGFAVWSADLTPIRQALQELEELHASIRVAAIAFECQEGMVVTNADRIILRVNHAFTSMTGFTSADVVGRRHVELKSTRHGTHSDDALWAEVHEVGGWSGEFWHRHRSQAEFPVQSTVTSVTDQAGCVTHYVFTLVDVTDLHQREIKRLQDERLQREALVREVHHRIKNNLQGIAGLLRQFEYAAPETREAMTQAISQVQSIAVIHGLQGQGVTEQVQIEALVRAIAQTIETLWLSPIVVQVPPDWQAWALTENEAVPIALILNELILNAVKHGDQLHQKVSIALSQDLSDEDIRLTIVNQGQLIRTADPDLHVHLGLSLISSLMPRHGGRLVQNQVANTVVTTLMLAHPVVTQLTQSIP